MDDDMVTGLFSSRWEAGWFEMPWEQRFDMAVLLSKDSRLQCVVQKCKKMLIHGLR